MAIWYAVISAFANQVIASVFNRFAARNPPEPPQVIMVVVVLPGVATNTEPARPW